MAQLDVGVKDVDLLGERTGLAIGKFIRNGNCYITGIFSIYTTKLRIFTAVHEVRGSARSWGKECGFTGGQKNGN